MRATFCICLVVTGVRVSHHFCKSLLKLDATIKPATFHGQQAVRSRRRRRRRKK